MTATSSIIGLDAARARRRRASLNRGRKVVAAFSLIEVTLAVGIMGFAFIAIIGLVPLGLTNFRATKNVSTASQISQQIFADVQATAWAEITGAQISSSQQVANTTVAQIGTGATPAGASSPIYTLRLPSPASSQSAPVFTRYFNDQGVEVQPGDPGAIYQANAVITYGTSFVQPGTTGTPTVNADLATLLVQVAYVPSGQAPNLGTGTTANTWTGTAGNPPIPIQIFPFEGCVSRTF